MAWLKRLSLSGSKADKQANSTCSNLSRRSWPFRKTSMTLEDDEEDQQEESMPALQRRSVIRPPVGGGEYKGALPGGQPVTPRQGLCMFEDCMFEDLLVQVFLNLSIEVHPFLIVAPGPAKGGVMLRTSGNLCGKVSLT